MPFPWSKKVVPIQEIVVVQSPQEIVKKPEVVQEVVVEPEVTQEIVLPTVDDKISVIEHKNGECLVSTREEDDETYEVEGDLCQGEGIGTSDQGSEEDLEEA